MKNILELKKILLNSIKPISKLSVADWADNFRIISDGNAEPGKWKTSRVPYMHDVMNSFTIPGIHKVVVKSSSQVGKALDVQTLIPTPTGFKKLLDVQIGDNLFDEQGNICQVTATSEIFHNHKCYEITFSDGAKIIADSSHNWFVHDDLNGHLKLKTLTTEEISKDYKVGVRNRYAIPVAKPLQLPEASLPIDPYTLGCWLGDGNSYSAQLTFHLKLLRLNLLKNKHIPEIYLRASIAQRMELLRGLMDTNKNFPANFQELVNTLGIDERRIISIREVESRPTKCIAVSSPSHLFLAGENFIPTHNSEVLMNVIGRFAQLDPAFIMIIQPTLELAQDFSKSRLAKMIEDTKSLTPLFYGDEKTAKSRDKNQTMLSKFYKGGRIVLAGANSAAGLASRPVRILLCDEVDRFPESATGNEGDPVDLAQKRMTTYWNYCMGLFSTPTIEGFSRIDLEYMAGTQEEWQHKCPNCGEFHKLDFRQMICDYETLQNKIGNRIVIMKSVLYRCPDCGFEFTERQMKDSEQKYIAKNPNARANGVRSFWVNTFSSPWLSWSEVMREWYEAKGNQSREKVVMNTRFGKCYEMTGEYEDENEFLSRRIKYNSQVPEEVEILTCAVDVQSNRLEYEIAGWSSNRTRYGIQRGYILNSPTDDLTWKTLDEIIFAEYRKPSGNIKISRTFIDSGFSTDNVYKYCATRQLYNVFPIKGLGTPGVPLIYKITRVQNYGIALFILGVNEGKAEIYSRLAITSGEKQMIYPEEDEYLNRGYDEVYFKEMISEHRVIRQRNGIAYIGWEKNSKSARNESLDLCVYGLCAVESFTPAKPKTKKKYAKSKGISF